MPQSITVDISANIARFSSQLDRATADMSRFARATESAAGMASKAFAALGVGLSFAAITNAAKASIDLADSLKDLSATTGITIENLSGLKLAATNSGTELEAVANGVNKLSVNIAKNGEGFRQLGIDAKDPMAAFTQLADVLVSIQDPQQRAAVANAALGKSYQELMPLLLEGGDSIRKMVDEGKNASGITEQMARDADQLNDSIAVLSAQFQGLIARGITPLLPGMNALLEYFRAIDAQAANTSNNISVLGDVFNTLVEWVATAANIINQFGMGLGALGAKINAIAHLDFSGVSVISKAFDEDVAAADKKLQALYTKLENPKKVSLEVDAKKLAAPSAANIQKFIGVKMPAAAKVRAPRRIRAGGGGASTEQNRVKGINDIIAGLKQDIALSKLSDEQRQRELELSRDLKNAKGNERTIITDLVKTKYDEIAVTDRQEKQWKALIEDANAYYDLKKANAEWAGAGEIAGFNERLAATSDALKQGIITSNQAKTEFDKLGQAFNDAYISPAKSGQDQLNQFMIQGARDMQTAFADFLFDPFAKGTQSMLTGFLNVIRRMAAEYAASQLATAFFGENFAKSSGPGAGVLGGLAGAAKTGISNFISSFFATGGIVAGPGISAFSGSIVNRPTSFAFASGIGLMGEAGPEAILPLKRGAGGKLGVEAGAGQRPVSIVNNFTLNQPADRRTQDQIAAMAAQSIKRATTRNL